MNRPASLAHLFLAFTRLALQGFGGVLAVAQRELVERLGWMDKEEFVETLAIAQVLPGPNVVNLSMMVGDRFFGMRGAVVALAGMLTVPAILVLALAGAFDQLAAHPVVVNALRGMGAVSAGLVLATAWKLLASLKRNPLGLPACLLLGALTCGLVVGLRWPLAWVILGLGSAAVGWAWWQLRPPRVGAAE